MATATEGMEGAGGKMSWISDYFESQYKKNTDLMAYMGQQIGSVIPEVGIGNNLKDLYSGYTDIMRNESSKAALRGSEISSFLSGLPVVGNFVRGIEGVNQLEDLYNNSGQTVRYPSIQTAGASGLGSGAAQLGKIASGSNDLYQYYAGESDNIQVMFG